MIDKELGVRDKKLEELFSIRLHGGEDTRAVAMGIAGN